MWSIFIAGTVVLHNATADATGVPPNQPSNQTRLNYSGGQIKRPIHWHTQTCGAYIITAEKCNKCEIQWKAGRR